MKMVEIGNEVSHLYWKLQGERQFWMIHIQNVPRSFDFDKYEGLKMKQEINW